MTYKNNPFNIRYNPDNKWKGQIEPKNGFCQFSDLKYGYRAAFILIFNYKNLHEAETPRQIITTWAPPEENNTSHYLDIVSNLILLDDPIETPSDLLVLMYAMYYVEQGKLLSLFEFSKQLRSSVVTD